jgi:hypothetical protein
MGDDLIGIDSDDRCNYKCPIPSIGHQHNEFCENEVNPPTRDGEGNLSSH